MEKVIRLKLRDDSEMIASFGVLIYKAIEKKPDRVYALDYIKPLAPGLDFGPEDIDEVDEPLISGNLEDLEGTYLVFENITTEELMGLSGGSMGLSGGPIGLYYEALNAADKQTFDLALQGEAECRTEELNSWTGPSLHI